MKCASEESYPGDLVSDEEDTSWLDGDRHAMMMYDSDEESDSKAKNIYKKPSEEITSPKMFDPAWCAKTFGPSYTI